jgi:hypothetical protein
MQMPKELREQQDAIKDLMRPIEKRGFMARFEPRGGALDVELMSPSGQIRTIRCHRSSGGHARENMLHNVRRALIDDLGCPPDLFRKTGRNGNYTRETHVPHASLALPSYTPEHIQRSAPVPPPAPSLPEPVAKAEEIPMSTTPVATNGHANGITYDRPPPAPSEPKVVLAEKKKKLTLNQEEVFKLGGLIMAHCKLVDGYAVYKDGFTDEEVARLVSDRCPVEKVAEMRQKHVGLTHEEHDRAAQAEGSGGALMGRIRVLELMLKAATDRIQALEDAITKPGV